jgi:hypothetical protein
MGWPSDGDGTDPKAVSVVCRQALSAIEFALLAVSLVVPSTEFSFLNMTIDRNFRTIAASGAARGV